MASLLVPHAAGAATATSAGGELRVADTGDEEFLTITSPDAQDRFIVMSKGEAALMAGEGCRSVAPTNDGATQQLECTRTGVTKVTVDLGPGSDSINLGYLGGPPANVSGGPGFDELRYDHSPALKGVSMSPNGVADDGPGERGDAVADDFERLGGSQGNDRIEGSDRDDVLYGGAGKDTIDGRGGDDLLQSFEPAVEAGGSPERDAVTCGGGDDAVAGDEVDRFAPDCETVAESGVIRGTRRPDRITGFQRGMHLLGYGGDDSLTGMGDDRLTGGPGDDTLRAGPTGRSALAGNAGNDRIIGRGGQEIANGGTGRDRISGARGDDRITSREKKPERDVVRCGPGKDRVAADRLDKVARDCETVSRR